MGNGQLASKEKHVDILLAKDDSLDIPLKYVGILLIEGCDPHIP